MLGTLMNLVQEGLSKLDSDGNYVEVNEAYAELLGYETKDLIGKHWLTSICEDDIKSAKELHQRLLDGESNVHARLRGIRKSGRKFEQQLSILAIREGKSKKPTCYYLFSVNVQHQVEARKELREITGSIAELKNLFEMYLEKK